jgi:hypothetical protein
VIYGLSWESLGAGLAGIAIVAVIAWALTALALRSRLRAA